MAKAVLEKAEKELAKLREVLESCNVKIRETGGPKGLLWHFNMRYKIKGLEDKIKDIKDGKIRIDEIPPEGVELEKRVKSIEISLEKVIKKEE